MESLSPLLVSSILGQGPQADLSPQRQGLSKGQLIAGILADMLAGATGRAPVFAPQLAKQREAEQEQANWGLKRQADLQDYEKQQQIRQKYDVDPMQRDIATWMALTPEQRAAYGQIQAVKNPFSALPNGQVIIRDPSLMGQFGGQQRLPSREELIPVDGGPTPPASGGFPYRRY